jgi:hypothetical protein
MDQMILTHAADQLDERDDWRAEREAMRPELTELRKLRDALQTVRWAMESRSRLRRSKGGSRRPSPYRGRGG